MSLFLLAMSVLMLEIALTRVFSVMAWHHFAYLVISLALLGFGAASSFLTVSLRFRSKAFDEVLLARYALLFSVATVLGFASATKVRFHYRDIFQFGDFSNAYSLFMLYVLVGTAFFFAGTCVGYLISRAGEAINRLYFADLVGAGIGALAAIAAINRVGAESTIYISAALGAAVAVLHVRSCGWLMRYGSRATLVVCSLMALAATRWQIFPVYFPPDKAIASMQMLPHYHKWHVVARVDVMPPTPRLSEFGGNLSSTLGMADRQVPIRMIFQDGAAPTGIVRLPDGRFDHIKALDYYLQGAPYIVRPEPEDVLIIGVGGGIDALIALHHDARHVVGVEMNPVIVDAVTDRYADFAGRLFDRDDVELIQAEGRHYLTRTDRRFEVIQLSGVDTVAAVASGAYALSENYLYTVEAIGDFWRHLRPDGVLSFSRCLHDPPRETLRLAGTVVAALEALGVEQPHRHLLIVGGRDRGNAWAETLITKRPLTPDEVRRLREWAERMRFQMLFDPIVHRDGAFDRLLRADPAERKEMIAAYPFRIGPITDDSPFFFRFGRWSSLVWPPRLETGQGMGLPVGLLILAITLVQLLLLSAALIIGPLLSQAAALSAIPGKARTLVYFAALGLGFITVELALLQRYSVFVGGPVYAMAVTLFAVLVFSGLGSLLSGAVGRVLPRASTIVLVVLAGGIVAEAVFLNRNLPGLMGLSHPMRCVVAVVAIAPLALLMGMPFPIGLRRVHRASPTLVPWAWGVNAVTTTIGSLLCVVLSMEAGFTACLYAAAAVYLIASLVSFGGRPGRAAANGG